EGPGVAPDETERIFEPFFRGSRRAPRPDKGNGLGLAIVREFIAAHGGRALVLPAERGAHFRIELPHAS
ncbi:sensor histidine kinase, partial [Salmonella enterica subsp. enterica serovar Typhimurium]|nr:sensor histidine kinase [Salmonella enterica subsp. enterica serovar Typhimurium]